ncbi:hypothetical protein [Lysobacter gummosus]|uniref:hypothetical protein n=1 Tax=Lysobacter gummosus TaxID=262324 RepID=UPI0036317BB8
MPLRSNDSWIATSRVKLTERSVDRMTSRPSRREPVLAGAMTSVCTPPLRPVKFKPQPCLVWSQNWLETCVPSGL